MLCSRHFFKPKDILKLPKTAVSAQSLIIGGFVPFTTIDYPGELAAVVFTQGCPFRCPFCYNRHLHESGGGGTVPWDEVSATLEQRKNILDGVVFSGGEPLVQYAALSAAMREAKELGFKIGLHTSGADPKALAKVLPLTDWVGFDIKAPPEKYDAVTQTAGAGALFARSFEMLMKSGKSYEMRTTCDPRLLTPDDILSIAGFLHARQVRAYALQEMQTEPLSWLTAKERAAIEAQKSVFFADGFLARVRALIPDLIIRKK